MKQLIATITLASVSSLGAQVMERSASLRGGGNPNNGKCTIEVVVDGTVEVEIRGDRAQMRNLTGRPPEWRRFECNGVMPPNPGDFRFQGIDGRGRQSLIRDPRRSQGSAVILIEDRDNGAEGYTFDIMWSAGGGYDSRDYGNGTYPRDGNRTRGLENGNARLFDRVRNDLNNARNSMRGRGDDNRLDRVLEELNELQRDYSRGRLNRGELNDVIDTLRRVVRDNRLSRRDRENLAEDLDRLRDLG